MANIIGIAAAGGADGGDCGNEFNSLRDLINHLIHHGPNHPDPPDWLLNNLADAARGLQGLVFAMKIADKPMRLQLAKASLHQAVTALNRMNNPVSEL